MVKTLKFYWWTYWATKVFVIREGLLVRWQDYCDRQAAINDPLAGM